MQRNHCNSVFTGPERATERKLLEKTIIRAVVQQGGAGPCFTGNICVFLGGEMWLLGKRGNVTSFFSQV